MEREVIFLQRLRISLQCVVLRHSKMKKKEQASLCVLDVVSK